MADDNLMSQDEIERLLNQAKVAPSLGAGSRPPDTPSTHSASSAIGSGEGTNDVGTNPLPAAPQSTQSTQTSEGIDSTDGSRLLAQDDIEKLLNQTAASKKGASAVGAARPEAREPPPGTSDEGTLPQGDVDYLLNQAERALESIDAPTVSVLPPGLSPFAFEELSGAPPSVENTTIDLIRDVELDLKIELGRTHMYLEDVLRLRKGSVVPLDKLAGDPVDIFVNGRLIARGEVLVLNDNFCVRVAELISGHSPAA